MTSTTGSGPTREPDITGPKARAWRVKRNEKTKSPPDWSGSIAAWLVHCPEAHPWWSWYRVDVVHLRDIPGVEPAYKQYPEAEYEFLIGALDPDTEPSADGGPVKLLSPINVVKQFHGLTDEEAASLCEKMVRLICSGDVSPDSDYKVLLEKHVEDLSLLLIARPKAGLLKKEES